MNEQVDHALQLHDKVTVENVTMPYIKSLYSCLNRVVGDGYNDKFELTPGGLRSGKTLRLYSPEEIRVINFFRFEGNSNPADNVLLYIIETIDGLKGTFINSGSGLKEHKFASLFMTQSMT